MNKYQLSFKASWESWPYLSGLEYLHPYRPHDEVMLLDDGNRTAKFKEWRGIVSSMVDKTDKSSYNAIKFNGASDILVVSVHKDANPQIIVETLDQHMSLFDKFKAAL